MPAIQLLTADGLRRCCKALDDDEPGFGALGTPEGNLPLKLMDVRATVVGLLSRVSLRQTFVNTLGVPLEATYIFPLPDRAAVSEFRFEVGDRVIAGAGSKLLGPVEIGSEVVIAANAVVLDSLPSRCVAAGIPARAAIADLSEAQFEVYRRSIGW